MKRSPLQRRTPLARTSGLLTSKSLERVSGLRRTAMKRRAPKVRAPEEGGDEAYLQFIRELPCCACGAFPPNHPHHEILNGRGKSQKAPDRRSMPMCFDDHHDFHRGLGRFAGWTREQKRVFQTDEIARLQSIHDERQRLGVWQEPLQQAV